jgi:periplasmic divalent cation tolerance protein
MSDLRAGAIVSVYALFASEEEARRIGRAMVEQRLAACVNLLGPCHSIYRWHGQVADADEVAAIFKTTAGEASVLIDAIVKMHSYELPSVVAWPISDEQEAFRSWVIQNSGR